MVPRLTLRTQIIAAVFIASLAGFAFILAGRAANAPADFNDNTTCSGHVTKGEPDPTDTSSFGVNYKFFCSGPILGYAILTAPERTVQGVQTEVFPTDAKGAVIGSDSFSCNGAFPGYGINCVNPAGGGTQAAGHLVGGEFFVDKDICKGPRLEPILYVTYVTVNAKGQPLQSIAGPFDLGRPQGCPTMKHYPALKIPKDANGPVLTGQEG